MSLRRRFVVVLACAAGLLIAPSAEAQQGEAAKVIAAFQGTLLDVMRNADGLGFQGRYLALAPAVAESFNLGLMVRRAVTERHWRRMSPQQRRRLDDAFNRYTFAVHADRFDDYNGQRFEVLAERVVPRGAVVVQSRIVKRNGDDVRIDYLMQSTNNAWRIVDVFLKGAISELATRRSEYVSVIKRRGYDGLIDAIEAQTRKIADGS